MNVAMTRWRQLLMDTDPDDTRATRYQRMCRESLRAAVVALHELPKHDVTGIVFSTQIGERFPETWRQAKAVGGRIRPRQFGQAVLNSAPGFASITWSLSGPQVVVVDGDAAEVARLLIAGGLADYMCVCEDFGVYMDGWLEK